MDYGTAATIGGYAGGIIGIGVFSGLLTWFFQDALVKEVNKRNWVLPLTGSFAGVGLSLFLFTFFRK